MSRKIFKKQIAYKSTEYKANFTDKQILSQPSINLRSSNAVVP